MMSCDSFRTRFVPSADDPALLDHIRSCDRCLDFAASVDPDVMFRALGGSEMVPPGGVDAFVGDVMRQVRVRQAETALEAAPPVSWTRRLALAASVTVAVTAGTLAYRYGHVPVAAPQQMAQARPIQKILTTKPIVETYDSDNATIVEVPDQGTGDDVKIVMIFDENLPKDL